MPEFSVLLGALLIIWLTLFLVLQLLARPSKTVVTPPAGKGRRLVVVIHGMAGREQISPLFDLVSTTFAGDDILDVRYDASPLSNANAYDIADKVETEIHNAYLRAKYPSIVLVGHSMGAMLVRKVLLWGHGEESDRAGAKGPRTWVDAVDRVVSLAGINRGWSIDPKPEHMLIGRYISIWIGERVGRATGTGRLVLSMRRGAPFIADSRVQWIHLARKKPLPQVIHLLGTKDDLVSRADATDLGVARGTVFVSLTDTDHMTIATKLGENDDGGAQRRQVVRNALLGDLQNLSPDKSQELQVVHGVKRIVYAVHGIRDRGDWARDVRAGIEARLRAIEPGTQPLSVAVNDTRYGYFAMLPFLLYSDRQANVRRLMDEYTENLARFPEADKFDYVGHSNGTYLLASALQRYRTMKVDRVYFAGSVVPTHYGWTELLDAGRVKRVVNVVSAGDWVVAIFPMLFEQLAVWMNSRPKIGALDLGGAGFRGFQDERDPQGRVRNVQFADGGHSIGVDTADARKLAAIVDYAIDGNERGMNVFRDRPAPKSWLDVLSNVQWLVWLVLVALVVGIGWLAFSANKGLGGAYLVFILLVLNSA